jgi:hypothetical protein
MRSEIRLHSKQKQFALPSIRVLNHDERASLHGFHSRMPVGACANA